MILNASKPVPDNMFDDNGNLVIVWTEPVEMCKALLDSLTSAAMKQYIDYVLNDEAKRSVNILLSTCQAMGLGKFWWSNPDVPRTLAVSR